jgi:hypothetical protein
MATSSLRFVLLGDDRASAAFSRFARQVDQSNRAIDRNNAALKAQGKASSQAQGGILGLTGTITGFNDAMTVGNRKGSLFARALGGINLATGLAEPAVASLTVAAGGLAAAFAAGGIGLGAYGLVLGQTSSEIKKLNQLQLAAAGGSKKSVKALQDYVKTLSPAFRNFDKQLDTTKGNFKLWADSLQGPVLTPLTQGLKLTGPLLKALTPAVKSAAGAIRFLISDLSEDLSGKGFSRWIQSLRPAIWTTIVNGGHVVINVVKGLAGVVSAFLPVSVKMTGGIEKASEAFARWGQTLDQHSGFQSLMQMARQDAPYLLEILKNLGVILKNVGGNLAGLATPANSKALLQTLVPLSKIFAQLSQNQALVSFVAYILLARSALKQFSPALTAAGSALGFTSKAAKNINELGFVPWLKNIKLVTVAQKLWNVVQIAFNVIMRANPIVLIGTLLVGLVAAVIYAYKHFKWFRDFVQAVWRDILAAVKAVVSWFRDTFLPFFTRAIPHAWDTAISFIRRLLANWLDFVLGIFGSIIHGAASMLGWVPGVGPKLKAAAAAFDRFRKSVNKSLLGINDRQVNVKVGFDAAPGRPGHQLLAAQGMRVPGYGGGDKWPALLEGGEAVVPKHLVPAIAPFLSANKVPGFAAGGIAGGVSVNTSFPSVAVMAAATMRVVQHLAQRNARSIFASAGGAGAPGGGVTRWAPVILAALGLLGQSPGWLGLVERRMNQESGGNPYAVNRWDSNWAAGTPSVGLMQVIGPTFAAYAGPFRRIGPFAYGVSEAPLANIYAGLNYALHRYGSLAALGQPGGYDTGGWLRPGVSVAVNRTGRPERVTSPRGEDAMLAALDSLAGRLDALIGAVYQNAGDTASGVAAALGGPARHASFRAEWSPRG